MVKSKASRRLNEWNRPPPTFVGEQRRIPKWILLLLATGCIAVSFFRISSPRDGSWLKSFEGNVSSSAQFHASTPSFDWKKVCVCVPKYQRLRSESTGNKVYPTETLHWVDCYERFQCARLEVPLDYSKLHEEKAAVALIRYPSKYREDDPRWRGPILHNPVSPMRYKDEEFTSIAIILGGTWCFGRRRAAIIWGVVLQDHWRRVRLRRLRSKR